MNTLGIALIWAAVQVTLLGLAAAALCVLAARRDARAGAFVVAGGLVGSIALTVVALCPLPRAWNWRLTSDTSLMSRAKGHGGETASPAGLPHDRNVNETSSDAAHELDTGTARLSAWLRGLLRGWESVQAAAPTRQWHWSGMLATVFACGVTLSLLRTLLGLWAVCAWRRRSNRIEDPRLLTLLEALRSAMNWRGAVEARECRDLSGAATVGWRRPVLLLPADWRDWSEVELRAVLAHELAHVRGGDYLVGLLARLSVALHFYHPLVYWLAGRLHLQQELAADAAGARFAGGRGPYLRALARLALRQEEQPLAGPARAFLPARGTLMRRIAMLRSTEATRNPEVRWRRRAAALGALLGTAVSVSALRGPESAARAEPPAKQVEAKDAPAPFDLTYVDENSLGILALRPAALLTQPGMRPVADFLNAMLGEPGLLPVVFKEKLDLRVEEIEEIVGDWVHHRNEGAPPGSRNSIMARLTMIRTVRPYDWRKKLQAALGVELVEERVEGQVFWKAAPGSPAPFPAGFMVYIPDGRTLVMPNSKDIHRILRRGKDARPKFAWDEAWRQVDRGWFAMAIHNTDEHWLKSLKKDGAKDAEVALLLPILTNTRSLAFGIDGTEDVVCQVVADCATAEKGETVHKAVQALWVLAQTAVEEAAKKKDLTPAQTAALQFARDLNCSLAKLQIAGEDTTTVTFRGKARTKLAELLAELVRVEMKALETESKRP